MGRLKLMKFPASDEITFEISKDKTLQEMQEELDEFIMSFERVRSLSETEILKNMILACHDEITEIEDDISNPEEWIDALHFVLSIANRLGVEIKSYIDYYDIPLCDAVRSLRYFLLDVTRLSRCFKHWSVKTPSYLDQDEIADTLQLMVIFINSACCKLGVSMRDEYIKKYKINIERQRSGY